MESSGTWHVQLCDLNTEQDFVHEAKVLISAVGGYTNPNLPVLPGLEEFEGPVVHTARWDKEYDLRGLNVAVVGNGCLSHLLMTSPSLEIDRPIGSGSQVVPAVIEDVNSLIQIIRVWSPLSRPDASILTCHSSIQQSPQHYVPMTMGNFRFGSKIRSLFSHFPFVLALLRWLTFWLLDTALGQFYDDPNGKRTRQERLSLSEKYIRSNAPGKARCDGNLFSMLMSRFREILASSYP